MDGDIILFGFVINKPIFILGFLLPYQNREIVCS